MYKISLVAVFSLQRYEGKCENEKEEEEEEQG